MMSSMSKVTCAAALMATAGLAHGGLESRWWVGGIVGFWDQTANWSATSGGTGGASMPGAGDSAWVRNLDPNSNKVVIYREPAGAPVQLGSLWLYGTGGGQTGELLFSINNDVLRVDDILARGPSLNFDHTGGTIETFDMSCGGSVDAGDDPGSYTLSGSGILDANRVTICGSDDDFAWLQDGGTSVIGTLTIGDCSSLPLSTATITGGSMTASRIYIGDRGNAEFNIEGGTVDVSILGAGDGEPGVLFQNGGTLTCDDLTIGDFHDDADGSVVEFRGGTSTFDTITMEGGNGGISDVMMMTGGDVTVTDLMFERDTCSLLMIAGSLNITDRLWTTTDDGDHLIIVTGGTLSAEEFDIGGTLDLRGGTVYFGEATSYETDWLVGPAADVEVGGLGRMGDLIMNGGVIHGGYLGAPFNLYLLGEFLVNDRFVYNSGDVHGKLHLSNLTVELNAPFHCSGQIHTLNTVDLEPTYEISAPTWLNDGRLAMNGATITCTAGSFVNDTSIGRVHGYGTINANVTNRFRIQGGTSFIAPLTINGSLINEPTALTQIEVTTGIFTFLSAIDVNGHLVCAGNMSITAPEDFDPTIGAAYTIINADSVEGRYDVVDFNLNQTAPYDFRIEYTDTSVRLRIVEPICDGDSNEDGIVDFTDLNAVLSNWNQAVEPFTNGDITGNGFVDFNDMNILLNGWGDVCG